MTIFEMLGQSGVLTFLGMGVVFSFLVILVICVSIMGKIFRRLGSDNGMDVLTEGTSSPQANGSTIDSALIAAITGAVNAYRKENK